MLVPFVISKAIILALSSLPILSQPPLSSSGGIIGKIGEPTWTEILDAIWQVESSCSYNPPDGDNGKAIGPYQIHRAYWADGARLLAVSWPYSDARDFKKARMITLAYLHYYGRGLSKIEAARCHNGGPKGYKSTATISYRIKIMKALSAKNGKNSL